MRIVPLLLLFTSASGLWGAERVLEVALDDVVAPITTEILSSAIEEAAHSGDTLLIVRLNTPGGLSEAMRASVEKLIASPVPIVTFVAPQGARAASAGFFLLEAGDVAAMSHGTNTGAAHPVILGTTMDPVMKEKLENDASASLRAITGRRGRNVALAESAVRQSQSFTEQEALDGHLVDLIASGEIDLLRQLDGREVTRFDGSKVTLHTRGAQITQYELSPRQRVLVAVSDPNVALILLVLGALGIYLEFVSPGLIFPGVMGSIMALVGLAALSVLPLNGLGVSLLVLALALFGLEMKYVSHGILTAGGAVAMVLGATMLVDSNVPEMRIHLATALGVSLPLALITAWLVTLVVRARRNKVVTGEEGMVGQLGTALEDLAPEGRVFVHGENWLARSPVNVKQGARVRVLSIRDLRLRVEPVAESVEGKSA